MNKFLMKNLLEQALAYSRLNWSVIPIKPGEKRPLVKWEKYQHERADIDLIKSWWTFYPYANIGIVTGQVSGIIVVDIDSLEGHRAYIALFGKIHCTVQQNTGNGCHLIFKHPGNQEYRTIPRIYTDIDIKADGGYILVPPSIHPNGSQYRWVVSPHLSNLSKLPEKILSRLQTSPKSSVGKSQNPNGWMQEALLGVKQGQRNNTCAKLAGYYLRLFIGDIQETERVLSNWNKRNEPPLDASEIIRVIDSVRRTRKLAG